MAQHRGRHLARRDAAAVVGHVDLGESAARDAHRDPARAGIERVLDELLDDRRRPFDHFARRDLADRRGVEEPNRHHQALTLLRQ
jgi:hypothetical protein